MTNSYSQNIDDCLASEIGDGGLESRDFQKYQEAASKTAKKVCDAYWAGNLPFLAVPHRTDDLSGGWSSMAAVFDELVMCIRRTEVLVLAALAT